MRKVYIILTGIFLSLLFITCKQFNADIDSYLSYWSAEVSPVDYSIDKPQQTSADGSVCVPSADDVTVTVNLRNPKNFSLVTPVSTADAGKVINFPGLSTQPAYGTDYTLAQTADKSALKLIYKSSFLKKHEWSDGDIGSEITLTADDGRVFKKKFSINLKANTAPVLDNAGIGKITDGSDEYYVLLFRVKDMDKMIGTERVHKDINTLDVTAGGVTLSPITLSIAGAEFVATNGNLLAASAVQKLKPTDPELPAATTQDWILRLKTDVKVGDPAKEYAVSIRDVHGLSSAVIQTSTQKDKLPDVRLLNGSTSSAPEITGTTESTPAGFAGISGKNLTATAALAGTTITGSIVKYDSGTSLWIDISGGTVSGTTPVPINLPALEASENEVLYKITVKAVLSGYVDSEEKEFFVKLLRQELPVLKLMQNFSLTDTTLHSISAGAQGYGSGDEDIIPDAGQYTAADPLVIYNASGTSTAKLEVSASAGTTIRYKLNNAGPVQSSITPATISLSASSGTGVQPLEIWAVTAGVAGPHTTVHFKVITAVSGYSELKNIVQNAPDYGTGASKYDYSSGIIINIDGNLIAPSSIADTEMAITGSKKLILQSSSSGTVRTINAAGRGRIFKISGSGTELTLKDIKLEGGYAADSKGGAVCVEDNGSLELSGGTVITPSTAADKNMKGKNDVYLANGANIGVNSGLTSTDPIVARITPADYNEGITVLTGTPIGSDYTKFTVTQPSVSEFAWKVDEHGKLQKISNIINGDTDTWKNLLEAVALFPEGSTITIDGEIKATNDPDNSGEIVIDKDLTIKKADGAASAVLDANKDTDGKPKHRIFKVEGGKTLTLTNLTLKGGKLDKSGEDGCGGGILVKGSTLNMTDCAVTGNTAQDGGGIYAKKVGSTASAVTITGSMIGGTETTDANEATGYNGGGIYIEEDCSLTMRENVKITGNKAGASGGGIYTGANCALTMDRCTVTSNTAGNEGGGIYAQGTLTLTRCTVSDNTANSVGGGAYLDGTVNIKGASTIAHNASGESGGGIYVASGCSLTLENATIGGEQSYDGTDLNKTKGNKAKNGGGIYAQGTLTMNNCTVSYNTAKTSGASSADGGGIYAIGNKLTMTVCTVKSNIAKTGGGIKKDNGEFTMKNCTLTNNMATANGGGIFTMGTCDFTMANCTLSGNRVNLENNESGGGVYMSGRKFTMKGASCITPSSGSDANKKGQNDVYLASGKMITVEGTLTPVDGIAARIIVSNGEYSTSTKVLTGDITAGASPNQNYTRFTVTPKGGKNWKINESGHLEPPSVTITEGSGAWKKLKAAVSDAQDGDVIIINNEIKATNTGSGPTANWGEISIEKNLTIKGNNKITDILDAHELSRIFDVQGGNTLTLENLTLKNGKKEGAIGGCILVFSGKVELTDCIIENCTAGDGGAIGVKGEAKLTNTVIKKCAATSTGGAIYTKSGKVTMTNCTLTGNTAKNGGAIAAQKDTTPSAAPPNVTISGGTIGGTGALDANKASKSGTDGGSGGGIWINNGTLILKDNAEVIGNTAQKYGGGIALDKGGTLTLSSGKISGNTAQKYGGGICIGTDANTNDNTGTVTMSGGEVSNNTASEKSGGGVAVLHGTFTMSNGKVSGNTAEEAGGGIYGMNFNSAKGEITVSGGEISGNTANIAGTLAGGGIRSGYKLTVSGGTIKTNKTTRPSGWGGGISVSEGEFTFLGGTVVGNTCPGGGDVRGTGIHVWNCSVKMSGSAKVDTNNDIYLSTNIKITVIAPLTGTDPVARITPETYNTSTKVLDGTPALLNSEHGKFTVTPKSGQNWSVDSNGKLKRL